VNIEQTSIKYIRFTDRARQEYTNLDALKEDLEENGMLNPITVREIEGPTHKYELLAGGRRFMASLQLVTDGKEEFAKVNVHVVSDVDDLKAKQIELTENINREAFTWQEEASLIAEIHTLKVKIKGEKTRSHTTGQSKRDTAKQLELSPAKVTEDIRLATAITHDKDIGKAKSREQALKMIRKRDKKNEDALKASKLQEVKEDHSYDSMKKKALINCYRVQDCMIGFETIPDGDLDMIELDPPYAIDLKSQKRKANVVTDTTTEYNEIDALEYPKFMRTVLEESYRTLSNKGWLILWFAPHPWFATLYSMAIEVGFKGLAMPAIWNKGKGQTNNPSMYLGNGYEMFFYFRKDDTVIDKQGANNVFTFPPIIPSNKIHPTERPVELIEDIMKTFLGISMDKRIFVPFAGSGNTILAGSNMGNICWGNDLSCAYKAQYTIRVDDGKYRYYSSYNNNNKEQCDEK